MEITTHRKRYVFPEETTKQQIIDELRLEPKNY